MPEHPGPGGPDLTLDDLVAVHRRGFLPRERWRVGLEVEKLAVQAGSEAPLPYDGQPASVRGILEAIARVRPSQPIQEGDHLIGLAGDWGTITLEPGGQIEWSSPASPDLATLRAMLHTHLETLSSVGSELGVRFLRESLHPRLALEEMIWMPKQRYVIMREYFRTKGRHAHRMMTQTASVQISLDYSDEADWHEKFRAGILLAPLCVAAFANSRIYEGRDTGFASFRSEIWRNTDDARCGAPDFVFRESFGLGDWVEYLLEMPMMFVRTGSRLEPAGGAPFSRFIREGCRGTRATIEDWTLHSTEAFTEARTKTYVELRSADLPPDDRILGVAGFWAGLLYHAPSREAALELLGWGPEDRPPTRESWTAAMLEASRHGLDGRLADRPLRDLVADAFALAAAGLSATRLGECGELTLP